MSMRTPFHFKKNICPVALIGLILLLAAPLRALADMQPNTAPLPGGTASVATTPAEDPAKPLGQLVGKLSSLDTLSAPDLAKFTENTITYSEAVQASKQPVSEKPILDALEAVSQGRKLDRKAANWDDLQARLEKILEKPQQQEQEKQQNQQQQNQNKQDKQDKQDQQQQQNQQQSSGGQSDQQKQDQQQQNKSSDQNQQAGQNQKGQNQQQGQQSPQNSPNQQNDANQQQQQQQSDQQKNGQQQQNGQSQQNQQQPQKADSAFGSMQKNEDGKKQQSQNDSRQQDGQKSENQRTQTDRNPIQSASVDDMQQVGGVNSKQQAPINARMVVPMQKLSQVRDTDSPAVIFQRMQTMQSGTQQFPFAQKSKGKDW